MSTNNKLRLVPVTGKYCQANFQGKKYEIWRKFPGTEKQKNAPLGTPVDYKVAVQLLCLQPPVVSLVPHVEGGKFVSQLDEKDLALIKEAQQSGQTMISNAFNNAQAPASESKPGADSEVIEALKAQNLALQETVKAQKEASDAQIQSLTAQFEAFKAQLSAQAAGTTPAAPASTDTQAPATSGQKPAAAAKGK